MPALKATGPTTRTSRRPTRKMQKAATRQALKDSALKCFGEFGYIETTIDHITEAAGVAHATFYTHFESKESLFDEIQEDFSAEHFGRLLPVLEGAGQENLEWSVRAAAGITLDYWDTRRDFIAAFFSSAHPKMNLATVRDGTAPVLRDRLTDQLVDLGDPARPRTALVRIPHPTSSSLERLTEIVVAVSVRPARP